MSIDHLTPRRLRIPAASALRDAVGGRRIDPPQLRSVWFEATDEGAVQLFTGPTTVKVHRLQSDPRASIVVAVDLVVRLATCYWDRDDPARANDLAEMLCQDRVPVIIQPEKVSRFSM